jgi:hypothetical protein
MQTIVTASHISKCDSFSFLHSIYFPTQKLLVSYLNLISIYWHKGILLFSDSQRNHFKNHWTIQTERIYLFTEYSAIVLFPLTIVSLTIHFISFLHGYSASWTLCLSSNSNFLRIVENLQCTNAFICCCFVWDRISSCCPGWPWIPQGISWPQPH